MAELTLKEEQELWEPQEVDNSAVEELKEDPDCGGYQSPDEAGPRLVQIKEELEEQMILQESIQAFPVIVSAWSEIEESLLHGTVKEENREDSDEAEGSSDTDDSVDWSTSAQSPTTQRHSEKQDRPFSCSVCERMFTRSYYLQLHMRSHQTHRPFSCSICAKDFTRSCYLQIHLKSHKGQIVHQTKHKDRDEGGEDKNMKSSLHQTVTENKEHRDGAEEGLKERSFSDIDDSGDRTPPAESHISETHSEKQEKQFSCPVCERMFTRKHYLQLHMRSHKTDRPFSCTLCAKNFSRKCHLQLHLKTHKEQRLYKTKHEDQGKSRKNKVKRSFYNQTVTEDIRQDRDGAEAGLKECSERSAESHQDNGPAEVDDTTTTTIEGKVNLLKCTQCGKVFQRMGMFRRHMRHHKLERPFSCAVCVKDFPLKYHLQLHMRSHQTERPFSCAVCSKTFIKKCYLQIHMKSHKGQSLYRTKQKDQGQGEKNMKNKTSFLHQTVKKENGEDRDAAEAVLKERSEPSAESPQEDTGPALVNDPATTTLEGKVNLLKCSQCGKVFQRMGMFRRHMRHHKLEQPFSCAVCAKVFPLKYHLQLHMRSHQTERPFSCAVCSKTFIQKCYLQLHLKTHGEQTVSQIKHKDQGKEGKNKKSKTIFLHQTVNKEKKQGRDAAEAVLTECSEPSAESSSQEDNGPVQTKDPISVLDKGKINLLKCTQCGKVFQRMGMFKRHMRHHKLEQPFSCVVCAKDFPLKYHLQLHMRSHQTERPFSCSVCSKTFIQKCYLQIHMKSHKGQSLFQIIKKNHRVVGKSKKIKNLFLHQTVKKENKEDRDAAEAVLKERSEPSAKSLQEDNGPAQANDQATTTIEGKVNLLKCSQCGKVFQRMGMFRRHMRHHKLERPFRCAVCAKDFPLKYHLQLHMRSHQTERPFSCTVCSKTFIQKCYLQLHLKTHGEQSVSQTKHKDQGKGGKNKKSKKTSLHQTVKKEKKEGRDRTPPAESHTLGKHSEKQERPFSCPVCRRMFTRKHYLQLHMRSHKTDCPFSCSLCAKNFSRKCYLQLHLKTHKEQRLYKTKHEDQGKSRNNIKVKKSVYNPTVTEEKRLDRDGEEAVLKERSEPSAESPQEDTGPALVNDPTTTMLEGKVNLLKCSQCGKVFQRMGMFRRHMRHHKLEQPFSCVVCAKDFPLKYHLQLHMRSHQTERPFSCLVCSKTFIQKCYLQLHMRSHQTERPFSCSVCAKDFVHKYHLKLHMMITHQTERPFSCTVCSKTFIQKCYLQLHLKTHGEQSVSQTQHKDQGKGGKNKKRKKTSLHQTVKKEKKEGRDRTPPAESHTLVKHSEKQERPFSCPVCERMFTRKHYLQLHMRSHQTERPFSCAVCAKDFVHKYHLKLHMMITHQTDRPFSCTVCSKTFLHQCYLQRHLQSHGEQGLCQAKRKDQGKEGKKTQKSSFRPTVKIENQVSREPAEAGLKKGSEISSGTDDPYAAPQKHTETYFRCSICQKNFTLKHHLQLHMRSHQIGRPFSCSFCTKNFTQKCYLQLHLKSHRGQRHKVQDKGSNNKNGKKSSLHHTATEENREHRGGEDAELQGHSDNSSDSDDSGDWSPSAQRATHKKQTDKRERPFSCTVCARSFTRKYYLQLHMRSHKTDQPFSCTVCGKNFTRKCHLHLHLKSHRGKMEQGKESTNKKRNPSLRPRVKNEEREGAEAGLQEHSDSASDTDHSGDWNPLKCRQCGKEFPTIKRVRSHEKSHLLEKPFKCSFCKMSFNTKFRQEEHIRTHTGEKPFSCSVCAKVFTSDKLQKLHMRIHTGERPFSCSVCSRTYTQKQSLRMHMLTHTGDKPFKCSVCEKAFYERKLLKLHMRIHTGEKPYKCSVCAKAFTLSGHLSRHVIRIHTRERPFKCTVCSKAFSLKHYLKTHMRVHTGERPYKCSVCAAAFKQNVALAQHMKSHLGPSFSCSLCSKTYARKASLKKHMRSHNEFKCSICGKGFVKKKTLEYHMNIRHTGARPFQCTVCIKDFAAEGWFQKHMRIHSGEKTLRCTVCSVVFETQNRLERHMAKHATEGPFRCSICSKEFRSRSSLYIHQNSHTANKGRV